MSITLNDHFMTKTIGGATSSAQIIFSFLEKYNINRVFDFGANIGIYSILFAKNWPLAEIHSFEPIYENYLELSNNVSLNNIINIKLNNFGIYTENCEKSFSIPINRDENNSGLYSLKINGKKEQKGYLVTIDSYLGKMEDKKVDFVKMDIEGCELDILLLNKDFFKKVGFLSIEINDSFPDAKGIRGVLEEYNYKYCSKLDRNTELWVNSSNVKIKDKHGSDNR